MPNHVENDLYLCGKKEDIQRVLLHIGALDVDPKFDCNRIIPYPEAYAQRDAERRAVEKCKCPIERSRLDDEFVAKYGNSSDGYNTSGYEWCCKNWGTKWGCYELVRRDYHGVCLTFRTAWSPPAPIIVALAKLFPEVTFRLEYFERGMAFCGGFSCPSKDDYYAEDGASEWMPGVVDDEWREKYGGRRGG